MKANKYVAGVFSGLRPFGPDKIELSVFSCAIFSCTNANDIGTCATNDTLIATISNRYQFQKLNISGKFRVDHGIVMPNTLTVDLVPLPTANYQFSKSDVVQQDL